MEPAICTSFDYDLPFSRVVPMVRQAGFRVISLGANPEHSGYATKTGRTAIRNLVAEHGMTIESVHAPFPEGDRLFSLEETERQESLRQCTLALDAAAELEGRIVVIHLIQPYDLPHDARRDRMIEAGRRSVAHLVDAALDRGVKLALENGQRRDYDEVLECLLAEFPAAHVGFCYDSGHEHVQGTCFDMLEKFGNRLFTVHIHDNKGSDTHTLPYEGTIDWAPFRAVLHRLEYSGNLLLEVSMRKSRFQDHAVFLAQAAERAGRLLAGKGKNDG